jgi:hypothetical protein
MYLWHPPEEDEQHSLLDQLLFTLLGSLVIVAILSMCG